jgi:hypothetical protein
VKTKQAFAVCLSVLALVAAGCGDDNNDTSTSTTTESGTSGATGATGASGSALLPADFIAEADAVCAEGDEAIDAEAEKLFGDGDEPSQEDQVAFVTDVVLPNIQEQLDGLEALDPPEEGAEEFATLIDDANAALDEIEADPAAFVESGGGDGPFAEVNKQAQALGLKDCGGG